MVVTASKSLKPKKVTKTSLLKAAKKLEKDKDKQWSLDIRAKWDNKCAYCGADKYIHAHHIIPRENRTFRHNMNNGIALCCNHHKFSLDISPHRNAFMFFLWFIYSHNKQYLELTKEMIDEELKLENEKTN